MKDYMAKESSLHPIVLLGTKCTCTYLKVKKLASFVFVGTFHEDPIVTKYSKFMFVDI